MAREEIASRTGSTRSHGANDRTGHEVLAKAGVLSMRGLLLLLLTVVLVPAALGQPSQTSNPRRRQSARQLGRHTSAQKQLSVPGARHTRNVVKQEAATAAALAPNDNCANAIVVTDGTTPFNNTGATTDGLDVPTSCNDPLPISTTIDSDLWYEYTATCTGTVAVSLCNSLFDTKLAAYAGCNPLVCPPTSTPLDCNDDFCGDVTSPRQSRITFTAQTGDCFTIRVGGVGTQQGLGQMDIVCTPMAPQLGACCDVNRVCTGTTTQTQCTAAGGTWFLGGNCATFTCPSPPPPNDLCANAIEVFSDVPFNGSTLGATGTDLSGCSLSDEKDVWHFWTADCTGTATFSLCGSPKSFDSSLAIYENSCPLSVGNPTTCNDDFCGLVSSVDLAVTAGTTYFIRVAGRGFSTSDYTLTVESCKRACCGGPNLGICVFQTPTQCLSLGFGATPQPLGTTCGGLFGATEACCFSDGSCIDMDSTCCQGQGGVPGGAGSACLGDANGNGKDDFCDPPPPDFDQNQEFDNADGDGNPLTGIESFYGGPTAGADLLWWLDRSLPALNIVPIGMSNTALVQDLAGRMATNSQTPSPHGHTPPYNGTWIDDLKSGIRSYLNSRNLSTFLNVSVETNPTYSSVVTHVQANDKVALLLGFYHVESVTPIPGSPTVDWRRTGGHYVVVADVDSANLRVILSDPDADAAEEGGMGTVLGGDHNHDGDANPATIPAFRDAGYDHRQHNAKSLVSQDLYDALPTTSSNPADISSIPGGSWLLGVVGDPLVYGSLQIPFHRKSSGGAFDLPVPTVMSDSFRAANGYPDPVVCQTYTVVEAAIIVAPAANQACCLSNGSCTDQSPVDCVSQGGTAKGPGTVCLGNNGGSPADDVCEACPPTTISGATPPSGTLDARQPHAPGSPLPRQGIGSPGRPGSNREPIVITLTDPTVTGAQRCFTLCETAPDPILGPNSIAAVTDQGNGVYEIILEHAIAAGAVTTIRYEGGSSFVDYVAHPANVDADPNTSANDVTQWTDCCLLGTCGPAFTIHRCDMDRTGDVAPPDLIRLIDVLGGGALFDSWLNTPRPANATCPPP